MRYSRTVSNRLPGVPANGPARNALRRFNGPAAKASLGVITEPQPKAIDIDGPTLLTLDRQERRALRRSSSRPISKRVQRRRFIEARREVRRLAREEVERNAKVRPAAKVIRADDDGS